MNLSIQKSNLTTNQTMLSKTLIAIFGVSLGQVSYAQTPEQIANQQVQYQQQKQAEQQQKLIPNTNVQIELPNAKVEPPTPKMDVHNPCFVISKIAYTTLDKTHLSILGNFDFALTPLTHGKQRITGQCLNIHDINRIVSDVQNRIIQRGYSTTRVLIGNQNLKNGTLQLTIIPGFVDKIKADTADSPLAIYTNPTGLPANFATALPIKSGDLLNIRDLETGLENLKRVPTANADFTIKPSSLQFAGYSDIEIKYHQTKKVRYGVTIDDSGSKSTGKYQGGLTISIDNPTWHNDLFYLSYSRDLGNKVNDNQYGDKGSENYSLGYVVPIKNVLFSANASHYTYKQTVAGANQDYQYSGESNNANLTASWLASRDNKSKTLLNFGGFVKSQKNFIDDTEVDVQRRKVVGFNAGVRHETRFGQKQLISDFSIQRGTGAFGALTPPESLFNEGTVRTPIYKLNVNFITPIALGDYQLGYQASLKGQYANTALVPSERLAIGGRYTVRGFDGERTLSGDMGAIFRQDFSFPIKQSNHNLYFGLDAGTVAMQNKEQDNLLLGHTLVGGAVGFKGEFKPLRLSYDVFAGYPIRQPEYFGKKEWTGGVSLGLEFWAFFVKFLSSLKIK